MMLHRVYYESQSVCRKENSLELKVDRAGGAVLARRDRELARYSRLEGEQTLRRAIDDGEIVAFFDRTLRGK